MDGKDDGHNRLQQQQRPLRVLLFPWLAHGHITPFLELGKRLLLLNSSSSNKKFHVYLCSTPVNLAPIREQIKNIVDNSIFEMGLELVELHLPCSQDLLPSEDYHTTKHLPPHLMPNLKTAFDLSQPSFDRLLQTLTPDILIYDFIQHWAPAAASRRNIPSVLCLNPGAAAASFFLHHLMRPPGERFPFPNFHDLENERNLSLLSNVANGISDGQRLLQCIDRSSSFVLVKSFREIESKYIDYLSFLAGGKEIIPVGSLVPLQEHSSSSSKRFMEWLDDKEKGSVVFVSFGSEYFMSKEEMTEIAHGLELSGVGFIWVVRFPKGDDDCEKAVELLEEALPSGFCFLDQSGRTRTITIGGIGERVVRGMVVEGWAPQTAILDHPSIGGFVTHCGWSSVMEGMKSGVPMIAMPLHLDQPMNARLLVELGVGLEVCREQQQQFYERQEVARVIKEVVVLEEKGRQVRVKAGEMAKRMAVGNNGGNDDFDLVAEKLYGLRGSLDRKGI